MVSGIFSIPLEAYDSQADEAQVDAASRGGALREYIGSEENRLVQLAAQSLLDRHPQYNPLVLYGPTGTGKSFLALGLAQRWRSKYPQDAVIVTCGPDFARGFANAVDTDNLPAFRKKSRSADLFVLDDVQQMQRKPAAQSELARAVDDLLQRGAAVLITDNTPPSVDQSLQPGLRSRLLSGLTVPLAAPGASARRLLLHRLAAMHDVRFSEDAIELLAGGTFDNGAQQLTVPRLNHAVIQLGHGEDAEDQQVDVDRVRQFLNDQAQQHQPTLRIIASLVAKHFTLTSRELRGPSRRRNVVRARGVAMLLGWTMTGNSLDAVGQYFGNRDHTTVLHACRRTETLQESDPAIARALEELHSQLKVS